MELLIAMSVLILALPLGYLLAWLCKDEIVQGRKWFKIISLLSFVFGVILIFYNLTASFTLLFISISTLVSLVKSFDKKFVK